MTEENPLSYQYAEEEGTAAEMNSGTFDGATTIPQGEVGELRKVELGDTGQGVFSEYQRLALGGVPDKNTRTRKARVSGNLQTNADADASDSVRIRFRVRKKRGGDTITETRWFRKTELEASNVENLPLLEFEGIDAETWAKEGRMLVIEARNPAGAVDVDYANSTTEFPFVGAY